MNDKALPAPGKKYITVVSDTVWVLVAGKIADETGPKKFSFSLKCRRVGQDKQTEMLELVGRDMKSFLLENTIGWRDQKLVLDPESNQPADFCTDAAAALFDIPGMSMVSFHAYIEAVSAKSKN